MMVILETRRVHWIRYQRFYDWTQQKPRHTLEIQIPA